MKAKVPQQPNVSMEVSDFTMASARKKYLIFLFLVVWFSHCIITTSVTQAQEPRGPEVSRLVVDLKERQVTVLGAMGARAKLVIPALIETLHLVSLEFSSWKQIKQWVRNHPYATLPIATYAALLLVCLLILWIRPVWLLEINEALSQSIDVKLPPWLGGINIPLRYAILVGFFHYHTRVLDAWIAKYAKTARELFGKKATVEDRAVHIPIPVILERENMPDLAVNDLRRTFNSNLACLLIWGEGGSGKTSVACLLAKWAMSAKGDQRLCQSHLMLPVLIERDLELQNPGNEKPFLKMIRDQLRGLINEADPPPSGLLQQLLKRRRLLVLVDGFSEMSDATRADILTGTTDIPVNSLVITSRTNERLNDHPKSTLKPLRIKGNRLAGFMEAYLFHLGKRDLFDDEEFFDACRRLSFIVGDRDITVLLAKLYADQIVRTKEGASSDDLPNNIPELMLCYLNDINRGGSVEGLDDLAVHGISETIAWECLKRTFRPMPANLEDVIAGLGGKEKALPQIKYLEHNLRIVQTVGVGRDRLRFALDPLSEYLASLHLVRLYRANEDLWRRFLSEADEQEGAPETIKGFLLALRDCCLTKGVAFQVPHFVTGELARRAGLTPEDKQKVTAERRVKKLIRDLKSLYPEDRAEAAKALGDLRGEAQLVVPCLIDALNDKYNSVRRSAVDALGNIGQQAKIALPELIELLKDEDKDIRSSAAFALRRVGLEATADIVIPALIEATRHPDEDVWRTARYALRNLGREARPAIPTLIELLKHQEGYVRRNAAYVLGRIGPEAQLAIPSLIELLQDQEAYGKNRTAAVLALERIGQVAMPALILALKDQNALLRLGAVHALGRFVPGAKEATNALKEALKDPDNDVRVGAANALMRVPGQRLKEAMPGLIKSLRDPEASIRWGASIVLGSIGPEAKAAIPTLMQLLNDPDEAVRTGVGEALTKIGQATVPALSSSRMDITDEAAREIAGVVAQAVTPQVARRLSEARVLWVDDRPENQTYERQTLEALGIRFTLSATTEDALEMIRLSQYDAIISDLGRPPDPRAGYTLLDALRKGGDQTAFIIYSASGSLPENKAEATKRGAFGITDKTQDLFRLVLSAITERHDSSGL
jgi:HEAT repeat protein